MTHEGFEGEASLLYRLRPPASMLGSERLPPVGVEVSDDDPLQNSLFLVDRVESTGDFLTSRRTLFVGETVSFSIAKPNTMSEGFYRNARSDELVLVSQGSGVVQSPFGDLRYRDLDLVHVLRSVTVRWVPDDVPHMLSVVESTSAITTPPHFRNTANGQFHEWAPYKERDLRTPDFREPVDEVGEFPVLIKHGSNRSRFWLDHHLFDVVGWDGYLYPFAINLDDYEPVTGRIDQLHDRYQVFVTKVTLMMVIVPRRRVDHPDSSPAQPLHMNSDIDEILYRIGGSNRSTDPSPGTITLHPRGLAHGPRPGLLDQPKTEMLPL